MAVCERRRRRVRVVVALRVASLDDVDDTARAHEQRQVGDFHDKLVGPLACVVAERDAEAARELRWLGHLGRVHIYARSPRERRAEPRRDVRRDAALLDDRQTHWRTPRGVVA